MPIVTVIIACYNQARFLAQAITSVKQQTYPSIELIVVNDGSTDDVDSVMQPFLDSVKYIKQANNGASHARNQGIKTATGKYCLCLDADDMLSNTYIADMVNAAELIDHPVIGTSVQYFGTSNQLWHPHIPSMPGILHANCISVSSLFKRDDAIAAGLFDESMRGGYEDWDFWIRMFKKNYTFKIITGPVLFYRRWGNSLNVTAINNHHSIVTQLQEKYKD